MEWRVPRKLPVAKFGAAAVFAVLAVVFAGDPVRLGLATVAAVGLAAYGARDLLAPVRLAADGGGVTVTSGYSARRHIPWADVERVRVDTRRRLLANSTLLEIDTGADLYFYSGQELGAPPAEVADALRTFRTGR
jgi:hypothetical protein